jgi:S-DNA-T family DNA segregation ATPase FtsK/SpoIIIE
MAAKTRSRTKSDVNAGAGSSLPRPWSEFLGIALLAVGVLVLGGLWSYQAGDGALMGPVGHLVAGALYAAFGMAAYLVALGIVAMGIKALRGQGMEVGLGEGVGFATATAAGCVLLHVMFPEYRVHGFTAGGLAGELVGEVSLGMFHHAGTYLVATTILCLGLLASTPLSSAHLLSAGRWLGAASRRGVSYLWAGAVELVRTQRDAAIAAEDELEQTHDDEEDWETEGEWDYDEGEEVDEEEEEEDEEDEEEEAEESASVSSRARKKTRAARKVAAAAASGAGARNRKRAKTESEGTEEIDVEDELGQELSTEGAKPARSRARGKKAAEPAPEPVSEPEIEEPEIVVGLDAGDGAPKPEPAEDAETAAKKEPAKKAPPRPEQLSVAEAKAAAAASNAAAKPARQRMPGVIRLTDGEYQLPPLQLFESAEKVETEFDRKFVLEQAQALVTALGEFRIKGKVTKIHPGPVITRYEFKPEPGTKLSRIESLENDIAMALEAIRIRILAPIPGKATVGFEVPNQTRETVYIKEMLADEAFGAGKKLPLALGQDITGKTRVADLAKAPHLLVAGATGSGKSVGVNSMICSLLYRCSPEDVRMIMIDPKMLELSIYEGIPHLLLPVVTDPEKAALALRWAVQEMERRYTLLSAAQVRDIAGYNKKLPELIKVWDADVRAAQRIAEEAAADALADGEDGADAANLPGVIFDAHGNPSQTIGGEELPDKPTKLPYIVVIIDEFADLMMVASKEVEQCVARIAAKARAAGIHLIVATQRPSVDVITGTIKNNFPSRIAFQVTSEADSRTILDRKGAKQLLGMGDMLYMDRGQELARVHGCFVSEDEILEVVKFVKRQAKPVYNMEIVRKQDEEGDGGSLENMDPLYDRAVEIVAEAQKVSTSMLQRRLGVGYNRAAKIVESMEEQGVIGPSRGTTPREVYVSAA